MAGSDQPFFTVFRELAKKLDNLPTQTNSLTKSEKKLQSLHYIKELSKNLSDKVSECNNLYQHLQNSYVQFRSITDLTSMIMEQQKTIIKEQESFLEEHGYIPYRECFGFFFLNCIFVLHPYIRS
uniref:BLOC-1-related complex subunit 5 n=1 Tax=Octopus bimaculoides TaxID=37653 RepID=A0A0L8FXI2_OCTBM